MLGPIYALEWKNANRQLQKYSWRWIYTGVLCIEMAVLAFEAILRLRTDWVFILEGATYLILAQQTAAILLFTPAFTAGSITDEKRRGTLEFMLMTPLTSTEIILGKWLGQATQVLLLISPGYFLIALLVGGFWDDGRRIYLGIAEQIILIYALTAFSLVISVLNQSTAKAIVIVYAVFGAWLAAEWLADAPIVGPSIWPSILGGELPMRSHVTASLLLVAVIPATLALAIWRLRPSHEQQRSSTTRAFGRWWDRPVIGEAPMRWKERFTGDWMSVPLWRLFARWQKCACLALLVAAILFFVPGLDTYIALGSSQLLFSGLFVAIRAAGAITNEKENQTWESLRTTHMDAYQIIRGKLWGQIDALRPFLFTYLAVALSGACFSGIGSLLWIVYTWLASWVFLYYLGAVGISTSVKATNTWRSILVTLTIGQASSIFTTSIFAVLVGSFALMGIGSLAIGGPTLLSMNFGLTLGSVVGLLWIFAQTEEVLQIAERDLKYRWQDVHA